MEVVVKGLIRYGLKFMKMISKELEHGCLGMGMSNGHGCLGMGISNMHVWVWLWVMYMGVWMKNLGVLVKVE